MRLCRFNDNRLGLIDPEGGIRDVTEVLEHCPVASAPRQGDAFVAHLESLGPPLEELAQTAPLLKRGDVELRAPVANPTKIVGTPANYLKHVEEAEENKEVFTGRYSGKVREQGLFLKAVSALVGPDQGVTLRFPERRTDHEMELGVIIGRRASCVSEQDALDYVAGYAIALDMVVRGPEDRSFRKSIDSYAVLGPGMVTCDEVPDPQNLSFSLSVNGELRQSSNTQHMILSIAEQISWASQFYTLWPGDIIMTGTCEGVGQVKPGDVMDCAIEHVGEMQVRIA